MVKIYNDYKDHADFLTVYVREAHPTDEWQMKSNVKEDVCQIVVADSGPGVLPDIRARLCAPFFTTRASGNGLGLAIAKRLVEAHEGSLGFEFPVGGGTRAIIHLPV